MRPAYDHRFFAFANAARQQEGRPPSRVFALLGKMLTLPPVASVLGILEWTAGFLLALPIPLYSTLIHMLVTSLPGLPSLGGMYLRALYYRHRLMKMESNVFIDQNVVIAHPRRTQLREFSYIDKGVLLLATTVTVGRRVHIAPRVIVTGGGEFEIEDYAGISSGATIITSSEVLKDGARCSGPMVDPIQRNVMRGKVVIEKDAFIGANATILPNVTIGHGSVAGADATIRKSTEPWSIHVGPKAQRIGTREPVKWADD